MKTKLLNSVCCILLTAMLGVSLTACGSGTINPQSTFVTVNDENVAIGVPAFLARYQQAQLYTTYSTYFGTTEIFDTVYDEEAGTTYGDSMKEELLQSVKNMTVLRQHAADYDVSLSEDEESKIKETAAKIAADNGKKVLKAIGTNEASIAEALRLMTVMSKMMQALGDEAAKDIDIKDEDVQQTTVSYFKILTATGEEEAAHASEEEHEHHEEEELALLDESRLADAETLLQTMQEREDGATVALSEVETELSATVEPFTGVSFTTSDPTKESMDAAIVAAIEGLQDGAFVDHVVESEDGTAYYVIRLDHAKDEEATESRRKSEIASEKEKYYTETVDGWVADAGITMNDDVWGKLQMTDSEVFTLKVESTEEAAAE